MRHHGEPLTPEENASIERPSQDHGTRFIDDQDIRAIEHLGKQKYEILSRPKIGPAVWVMKASNLTFTKQEVIRREKLAEREP